MASRKLLQWANSKSVGRTTEIAVMAPIKKGCVPGERRTYEERVRDVVANLAGRIERGIPQELGRVPTIHMARIFVIRPEQYLLNSRVDGVDYYDTKPIGAPGENANVPKPVEDVAVDGEDPAELGDRFRSWLMTLVIFDADLKPYMREVAAFLARDFDRVFENCEDFDTTARWETFWQWVRRYQISMDLFYATYPDLSVTRIRQLEDFKRRFDEFVARVRPRPGVRVDGIDELFDQFLRETSQYASDFPSPGGVFVTRDGKGGAP